MTNIILVGLSLVFVTTSAFSATSPTKKIRIGVSFGTLQEERWSREKQNLEKLAKTMNFDLVFQSANADEVTQSRQIENLITQKVDVLLIVPQNRKSVIPVIQSAKKEGIPVIAYDRFVPSKAVSLYVSFDSVKVGEAQAKAIVALKPKGNYLWLGGDPSDDNATLLRKGHMNILKPYIVRGDIKIVTEQWCTGWSAQEALKHAENALTANKNNIDAVIASNDGTAGGAIQALTAQGLQGKVPVSGQDAELAAVQRVVGGTQAVTVYKDIFSLAQSAAKAALELAAKKKVSGVAKFDGVDSMLLDVVPVTKANVDKVIIESGFHKKRDVYRYVR